MKIAVIELLFILRVMENRKVDWAPIAMMDGLSIGVGINLRVKAFDWPLLIEHGGFSLSLIRKEPFIGTLLRDLYETFHQPALF